MSNPRPSILRPKALRPGDVVAVAALSSYLEAEDVALVGPGVAALEAMGFEVRVSPLVGLDRAWWWSAAKPTEIAAQLNGLLRDPEVRAIVALVGGRTALSYLDLIEYEAIQADSKLIMGFSDIDTLLLAIHARTGVVTVHGDMVVHGLALWPEQPEERRAALADIYRRLFTSASPAGLLPTNGQWECWREGRAEGRLLGGLLNRVIAIQATPFALRPEQFDGTILFWEELATSTAAIWNNLHVLRYSGVLDRIAGMVVGRPTDITPTEGGPEALREVVLDVVGDRAIPIIGNVDIGHDPPNIPLPLGVRAAVDATALTIELLEPAVSA